VPAKRAWLPAESTDVRITVFMKDAANAEKIEPSQKTEGGGAYLNPLLGILW
jgi:hypothetical protein